MQPLIFNSQDSDSEDDEPKVKKVKSTTGAPGFLGSLPAPRGSSGGKNAGRAFIPYTLTKEKPASNKASASKAKTSQSSTKLSAAKLTDAYSDSDDDAPQANFFSLDSEPKSSSLGMSGGVNATPSIAYNAPVVSNTQAEEKRPPRITAASLYNMTEDSEYGYNDISAADQSLEETGGSQVDDMLQGEQVWNITLLLDTIDNTFIKHLPSENACNKS